MAKPTSNLQCPRAPGDAVQLSKIRIPARVHAKLAREAAVKKTTLNAGIADHLENAVRETDALGGPRATALLKTFAALIGDRDESWLDDPDLFNLITNLWIDHIDCIRPKRFPIDEDAIMADFKANQLVGIIL